MFPDISNKGIAKYYKYGENDEGNFFLIEILVLSSVLSSKQLNQVSYRNKAPSKKPIRYRSQCF